MLQNLILNKSGFAGRVPQCRTLPRVIAVVGCDGAGKSRLTGDLHASLQTAGDAHLVYLGQDSGNILRAILGVPLIGSFVGRFLKRKSQAAHNEGATPAKPDALTVVAIYLLSKWRHRKFRRMLGLHRQGAVIIADRYPQAEVSGFYFDGPGLLATGQVGGFRRWLAGRERRLYVDMAVHVPALLVRLNVDADTAHARKPDHKLAMLRDKVSVIPTLGFNAAPILDLDGTAPYPEVLEAALVAARKALAADGGHQAPH